MIHYEELSNLEYALAMFFLYVFCRLVIILKRMIVRGRGHEPTTGAVGHVDLNDLINTMEHEWKTRYVGRRHAKTPVVTPAPPNPRGIIRETNRYKIGGFSIDRHFSYDLLISKCLELVRKIPNRTHANWFIGYEAWRKFVGIKDNNGMYIIPEGDALLGYSIVKGNEREEGSNRIDLFIDDPREKVFVSPFTGESQRISFPTNPPKSE